ncbi:MAG TPA: hypothetical protein VGI43_04910 [Mucilaginibacter sp.]
MKHYGDEGDLKGFEFRLFNRSTVNQVMNRPVKASWFCTDS